METRTILPKKENLSHLGNYHGIIINHIINKIVASNLKERLKVNNNSATMKANVDSDQEEGVFYKDKLGDIRDIYDTVR